MSMTIRWVPSIVTIQGAGSCNAVCCCAGLIGAASSHRPVNGSRISTQPRSIKSATTAAKCGINRRLASSTRSDGCWQLPVFAHRSRMSYSSMTL
jgi:hypothetical protein